MCRLRAEMPGFYPLTLARLAGAIALAALALLVVGMLAGMTAPS